MLDTVTTATSLSYLYFGVRLSMKVFSGSVWRISYLGWAVGAMADLQKKIVVSCKYTYANQHLRADINLQTVFRFTDCL